MPVKRCTGGEKGLKRAHRRSTNYSTPNSSVTVIAAIEAPVSFTTERCAREELSVFRHEKTSTLYVYRYFGAPPEPFKIFQAVPFPTAKVASITATILFIYLNSHPAVLLISYIQYFKTLIF